MVGHPLKKHYDWLELNLQIGAFCDISIIETDIVITVNRRYIVQDYMLVSLEAGCVESAAVQWPVPQ